MTQNISSKMQRSWMIQNRHGSSYNTSKSQYIFAKILSLDEDVNKNLLFSIGYNQYTNNINIIQRSSQTNDLKLAVLDMFYSIKQGLSDNEERQLGIYIETSEDISAQIQVMNESMLSNPNFIFNCFVYNNFGKKNLIIRNFKKYYKLIPGNKYIFNVEHESNDGTLLSFSHLDHRREEVNGMYRIGTPGTKDARIIYIPEKTTTYYSIFVFNKNDYSNKSFDEFGYVYKQIFIEYAYRIPFYDSVFDNTNTDDYMEDYLPSTSVFHTIENNGPKYIVTSDASYNAIISDPSMSVYVSYVWRSLVSYTRTKYGLYYGHYKIQYKFNNNRITILNKGKENLIQIISGGGDKSYETHYLTGLDETGQLDGSYNFYKSPLTLKITGDFGFCSLYTSLYGYNELEDFLFFDSKYATAPKLDINYEDNSMNNILQLYPESTIFFHDVSSNNLNIYSNDVSINDQPRISLNYSSGNVYDANKWYGLYKGQYIIKYVPMTRPIAIINQGKKECIKYFGSEHFKQTRLGPDGTTIYDFYYGTVIIQVFGNFGRVSIYEYHDGFCGAENLLIYSEELIDISGEFQSWYNTVDSNLFEADCSGTEITNIIDYSFNTIHQVSSYISCDVSVNITFDDISDSSVKYAFSKGNFVLMNVPSNNPIAFLNKGLESYFFYDGYYRYSQVAVASDGNLYTYYYGNINITVFGDFGRISFESLNNGYLGGFRKILYNDDGVTEGLAIHSWDVNSYFPTLLGDVFEGARNYYINVRIVVRSVAYSEDYVSYRFSGYDRNGSIDESVDNPNMTFSIGDVVYFSFGYDNNDIRFGIYEFFLPISDEQVITNNRNNTNSLISWIPTTVISNYYHYRSSDTENNIKPFMSNHITILNNSNAEIMLDISLVHVSQEEQNGYLTILPETFTIIFNETFNINSSKNMYIYNKTSNEIEITVSGTNITKEGDSSAVYTTNFTSYNMNSLNFDSSYLLLIDDGLFTNVYDNGLDYDDYSVSSYLDISAQTVYSFSTEQKHAPLLTSIDPASNSYVDVSDSLSLTFTEPVTIPSTSLTAGNTDISFIDISTNNIVDSSNIEIDNSNNTMYIYFNNLDYDTTYRVNFGDYSIVDLSNIEVSIADSSLNSYFIQTIPDPRPQVQYVSPNNDLSNVYLNEPVAIVFNEPVYFDTSGNGKIQITDLSSDIVFDVLDLSNNTDISGIVFGSGTNTLRIYPFEADATFTNNTTYGVSITDDAFHDISNNYYVGNSDSEMVFTTGDISGTRIESLGNNGVGNIISDGSNSYYIFNDNTVFDNNQYSLMPGSYVLDVSQAYPIAILNSDISNLVTYDISNAEPIVINVSGGSVTSNESGDYFTFSDDNDNEISLANGSFKFMRGRSYSFITSSLNSGISFKFYYDSSFVTLDNTSNGTNIVTLPITLNTYVGSIYYCIIQTGVDDISTNLTLLYNEVSENNENGNGYYDFFYGNIELNILDDNFGSFSFYTYNNGYMGGKYAFTFTDTYTND